VYGFSGDRRKPGKHITTAARAKQLGTNSPAGRLGRIILLAINFTEPDGKPQKNKCLLWKRILLLNPVEKVLEFCL
jgi:hypothetical protein